MKPLDVIQMELIEAGSINMGCAWTAWAAGVASVELGPLSFVIGAAVYAGCVQMT